MATRRHRIQRQRENPLNDVSALYADYRAYRSCNREKLGIFVLSAGMDDYLSKPVNRTELPKVLKRWLGEPVAINSESPFVETQTSQNLTLWKRMVGMQRSRLNI